PRPRDVRHGGGPGGAEADTGGDAGEPVLVAGLAAGPRPGLVARLGGPVLDRHQGAGRARLGVAVVLLELEPVAGGERRAAAAPGDDLVGRLLLLHADLGQGLAVVLLLVQAGVVVDLVLRVVRELDLAGLV